MPDPWELKIPGNLTCFLHVRWGAMFLVLSAVKVTEESQGRVSDIKISAVFLLLFLTKKDPLISTQSNRMQPCLNK